MNIEVNNEQFCENNSAIDSNNQVLSKTWDSNRAPSLKSNVESSIFSENGATPVNSNNQSDVSNLGESQHVLCRSERI